MICQACIFETARLLVKEWHSLTPEDWHEQDLAEAMVRILTERVTRQLPTGWQGKYTRERALKWIMDRDQDGTTLLVVEKSSREPIGNVFLFELPIEGAETVDLRLGYLLAEGSWGRGLASELLRGLVNWCERNPIQSITGGVERGNVASARVLEKSGFVCDKESEGVGSEEQVYRLQLGTHNSG